MNSITSRIQKKFDDLWYNSNLKSIDGIWKRMNKDGFKISNYQVRHLVHEKRREYIVDRDEESEDDDDYIDDEEEAEEVKVRRWSKRAHTTCNVDFSKATECTSSL